MLFAPPRRRRPAENIVPMINVVFLLLIFFLMTAQIAPPEPFEIVPPVSDSDTPSDIGSVLYVASDGTLDLDGARGEAVFEALSARDPDEPLLIRADERVKAAVLAGLLPRLAELGIGNLSLATGTRR